METTRIDGFQLGPFSSLAQAIDVPVGVLCSLFGYQCSDVAPDESRREAARRALLRELGTNSERIEQILGHLHRFSECAAEAATGEEANQLLAALSSVTLGSRSEGVQIYLCYALRSLAHHVLDKGVLDKTQAAKLSEQARSQLAGFQPLLRAPLSSKDVDDRMRGWTNMTEFYVQLFGRSDDGIPPEFDFLTNVLLGAKYEGEHEYLFAFDLLERFLAGLDAKRYHKQLVYYFGISLSIVHGTTEASVRNAQRQFVKKLSSALD